MNLRFSVEEMIRTFGPAYSTIDIRSAAVRVVDGWLNVYAVVRLTYEEPDIAEARLRKLEMEQGTVNTDLFRVFLGVRPFSEWNYLCEELADGKMHVGGYKVLLDQPVTFMEARDYLRTDYTSIRPFDSWHWPVAHYYFLQYGSSPFMHDALTRQAARLGYSDADEAANLLCGINVRPGYANGHQLVLSLPVFAMIQNIRASLRSRRMEIAITKDRNLPPLKGTAIFWGPRTVAGEPPKRRLPVPSFTDSAGNKNLSNGLASIRLLKVLETDTVEVKLLHPDAGEVHSFHSYALREVIPPPERNILFEALKFFCPESRLKLLLGSPHTISSKRLKPEAAFEAHISWLLGFFGLATAVLGEYENIVAPETGVHRGSIDIIAASQRQRRLLLVACTIGAPKEDDFTNLLNTAEIVSREIFGNTGVRVQALVCTSVRGVPMSKDLLDRLAGLPILDGDRLELLLKLIGVAREREFFSLLDSPIYSPLRDPEQVTQG